MVLNIQFCFHSVEICTKLDGMKDNYNKRCHRTDKTKFGRGATSKKLQDWFKIPKFKIGAIFVRKLILIQFQ